MINIQERINKINIKKSVQLAKILLTHLTVRTMFVSLGKLVLQTYYQP